MKVKLKNVGPIRKDIEFDLSGNCVIEGDNGLGKSTIVDSIGVALYGPFNEKKDTKRLFSLNSDSEPSYVELKDFEFCGKKYASVKREIYKKGNKYPTRLTIDGSVQNEDFFEQILPLERYLLMTDYSYFSQLTGDKKIIALNSFFETDNAEIFADILSSEKENIEKALKELRFKAGETGDIDENYLKKAFIAAFPSFGLEKSELKTLGLEDIKELSLTSSKELKKILASVDAAFTKMQAIPKNSLSADTKEEILTEMNKIKESKNQLLKDIETFGIFNTVRKVSELEKKLPEGSSINWSDKAIDFGTHSVNAKTLESLKTYVTMKDDVLSMVDTIEEKLLKTADPVWEGYSSTEKVEELVALKKEKKYKMLLSSVKNLLKERTDAATQGMSKEKLEDPLLVSLYDGEIRFVREGKELGDDEKTAIMEFIKSKFITDAQISKFTKWKKVSSVLEDLVNKAEYGLEKMGNLYSSSLSSIPKEEFLTLAEKTNFVTSILEEVSELRSEYSSALKSKAYADIGSTEKFLDTYGERLSFTNKETLHKNLEELDKKEFLLTNKLNDFTKNEKNTTEFIRLTQEYKNGLANAVNITVFEELTSKFAKSVLEKNFAELNDLVETGSNGLLTLNKDNKKTVEIMYVKPEDGLQVPYDNMSEGLKILSDNLLMSSIHQLQNKRGTGLNFVIVDEISAVSPKNKDLLVKSMGSLEGNKILTITSDEPDLKISALESFFKIGDVKKAELISEIDTGNDNQEGTVKSVDSIETTGSTAVKKRGRKPKTI